MSNTYKKPIIFLLILSMVLTIFPWEGDLQVNASSDPPMELSKFGFNGVGSTVTKSVYNRNIGKWEIEVTIPRNTDKTRLVATYDRPQDLSFTVDGGAENYGGARNFSNSVTYTLSKRDGTKMDYVVSVNNSNSSYPETRITSFDFRNVSTTVDIDHRNRTINVKIPYNTSKSNLIATFGYIGSTVTVEGRRQYSNETSNSFWNDVTYRVQTSETNYVDYKVSVTESSIGSSTRRITSFGFKNVRSDTDIDQSRKVIKVKVPYNTNLRNLVATFTFEGREVTVDGRKQYSGEDSHDFSYEVVYRVRAENGDYDDYRVIVQEEPEYWERAITEFSFRDVSPIAYGVINERDKRITVTVPRGTNLRNLVATFDYRGDRVTVDGYTQRSGYTSNDFTRKVIYRVTDRNDRWVEYEVDVRESSSSSGGSSSKRISDFSFRDLSPRVTARIDQDSKWIVLVVPYGTNLRNLVASFSHNGDEVTVDGRRQYSGSTSNDFRDPLIYRVTAEDGSYQEYTVVVQEEPEYSNKAITEFTFNDLRPKVYGVINERDKKITVDVPRGTNLRNLVATFSIKGKEVTVDGRRQNSGSTSNDFSSTVIYRVKATDDSWVEYKVDVRESDYYGGNRDKQITSFSFRDFNPIIYGDIDHSRQEIRVRVPYGTNLRNLVATFSYNGERVTVDGRTQYSGSTSNDFYYPVYYRVVARDGSYEEYKVTVTEGNVDSDYNNDPYNRYDPLVPSVPPVQFVDMHGHWAIGNVRDLVGKGAISGYPDGSFKPERPITRAEMVSIIVKAFELVPKNGKVFKDTQNHWARTSIATAYTYGIVDGYSHTHFGPDDKVTREQMAAMIVKAANLRQATSSMKFKDQGQMSPWAVKPMQTAIENGLLSGYPDQTIRPKTHATRVEAVTVIVRALKLK